MKQFEFLMLISARDNIDWVVFEAWSDRRERNNETWDVKDLDFNYKYDYRTKLITVQTPYGTETFTLDELSEPDDFELKMLHHSDYYDGPLSGLALYNGQKVWFALEDYEDENLFHCRTYGLYELSKEDLEEIEYWHKRFQQDVGYHTDYGDVYTREGMGKDKKKFDDYYRDAKKFFEKPKNYTNGKLLTVVNETQFDRTRSNK